MLRNNYIDSWFFLKLKGINYTFIEHGKKALILMDETPFVRWHSLKKRFKKILDRKTNNPKGTLTYIHTFHIFSLFCSTVPEILQLVLFLFAVHIHIGAKYFWSRIWIFIPIMFSQYVFIECQRWLFWQNSVTFVTE